MPNLVTSGFEGPSFHQDILQKLKKVKGDGKEWNTKLLKGCCNKLQCIRWAMDVALASQRRCTNGLSSTAFLM